MRNILWIWMCLIASLVAGAQAQQGIVRTLERPHKPSIGIEGVTIKVLEYPNVIVSKKGGKFSFALDGKRPGAPFTVSRVQKKGFSLVDKQLKGRRFAYSPSVPLEIVMVSDVQLEKDKKLIEEKAYDKAQKDFDKKLAALEKQLKEKSISEKEYRQKYEELSSNYSNYVQMIDQMAERYAMTDFSGMDEVSQKIQTCIEQADLEQADILIDSKGDFDTREQELLNKQELKEKSEQLSQQLQEDIDKEFEDLVRDYYHKFAIQAANYQNDSAVYYLERMVRLDTTSVDMLKYIASFIDNYLLDYHRALGYYQRALIQAQEQYGKVSEEAGRIREFIGLTYDHMGDWEQSLQWHHKALDIYEQTEGLDNLDAALVYTHIGRIYMSQDSLEKALEYTLKGLVIRSRNITDMDNLDYAQSYNNLGVIYTNMGDYERAMECHMKALEQRERVLGSESEGTALSYLNVGTLYSALKEYDNALSYYQKAHNSFQAVYGPTHPKSIMVLGYMASVYYAQNDLDNMLDCYRQAVAACEQYYGPDHPNTQKYRDAVTALEEKQKQQSSND